MKASTAIIIDNDPYSIRLLNAALRSHRYTVVTTERAFDLDILLRTYRPSLVLMNAEMQEISAPSVMELIRKAPELSSVTVLLHAGLEEDALAENARAVGADGYVKKSRTLSELSRSLEPWLTK